LHSALFQRNNAVDRTAFARDFIYPQSKRPLKTWHVVEQKRRRRTERTRRRVILQRTTFNRRRISNRTQMTFDTSAVDSRSGERTLRPVETRFFFSSLLVRATPRRLVHLRLAREYASTRHDFQRTIAGHNCFSTFPLRAIGFPRENLLGSERIAG